MYQRQRKKSDRCLGWVEGKKCDRVMIGLNRRDAIRDRLLSQKYQ
ncbi:MAG: hypothetical protein RIE73_02120 [Coleofasciculus sp. C1-SOL-03]